MMGPNGKTKIKTHQKSRQTELLGKITMISQTQNIPNLNPTLLRLPKPHH